MAVFHTDPTTTVTPVPGGFLLRKDLSGFANYGVADHAADILYSTESDQWEFDMSVIPGPIVSATAVISLALDDHYGRPESDYVGTITLNGTEVFSGGFASDLGASHGVPGGEVFTNWQAVRLPFSSLAPPVYTIAIHNNTTGEVFGDWIAIDFIEIHVLTQTVTPVPGGFVLRKELNEFANYGVADQAADILYSTESDQWEFDMSVIPGPIVSATVVISLALDDHYGRPESDYVGTITLNGTEVFSGGFASDLGASHGAPFAEVFTNWRLVRFPFSSLAPPVYTIAIHNNTTGELFGDWIAVDFIEVHAFTHMTIAVDIQPGSDISSINPENMGAIPVAILSTPHFDAPTQVDRTSLMFGRTGDEQSLAFCNAGAEDVNADGMLDLVCHFTTQPTGFQNGDTEGILKGETVDGTPIQGRDHVRVR
jgi:hypothetical protein